MTRSPPTSEPGSISSLPGHRVPLLDGWSLWRTLRLKSAGFEAKQVLRLASPMSAQAIDRLLALEAEAQAARTHAVERYERAMAHTADRRAVERDLKRLARGELPAVPPETGEVGPALAELARAEAATQAARSDAERNFIAATIIIGQALRDIARDGGFREALAWQNRGALHHGVAALTRRGPSLDSKTRENERLVASYFQRYCVKNDTIGFFGPVGWGALAGDGETIVLVPGPTLLASRNVYFEFWAVDALARTIAARPGLAPYLAPRRMPSVRMAGTTLHHSGGRSMPLGEAWARLVNLCDGERSARQIAAELLADPALELSDEEDVLLMLEQLVDKHLVTWTLELSPGDAHPERALRALVSAVSDEQQRAEALAPLDELEAARDAVAHAAGDASRVDVAIEQLEATFTRLTGEPPTRRGGEAYAGRGLIYEDCRRNLSLTLGPEFLGRLGPPLTLLLQSARWYTYTIAARYRELLSSLYQELRASSGAAAVNYLQFWKLAAPHFSVDQSRPSEIVRQVGEALRARWNEILALSPDEHRIERTVAELRERVATAFAAPHPGWPSARYHSPDVLIAASDVDAIRRGDYQILIGEIHPSTNTLLPLLALSQHPAADELLQARAIDLPDVGISPVQSKQYATRADQWSLVRHDLHLEVGETRSWRPRAQVLSIGELVVEERDGALVVRTEDERAHFDIIAFIEQYLVFDCLSHFSFIASARHTPRVAIDGVVVTRERWRFAPEEIPFAHLERPYDRFVGGRRWATAAGLPRWVFFKIPEEPKPYYLDFESPVFVEIFAKMVRKASSVSITEMLPTTEQAWLTDAEGKRYVSEMRLAAVDPEPWRAPAPRG